MDAQPSTGIKYYHGPSPGWKYKSRIKIGPRETGCGYACGFLCGLFYDVIIYTIQTEWQNDKLIMN
jgi:hypothetical protein